MLKKGTKLYSILKFKCPECNEGDFFVSHPYNLKQSGKIYEKCKVCGCDNNPEPGFYYGAMYVSYGIGVAVFVSVFLIIYLTVPEPTPTLYITAIISLMVVFAPLLYALSKIIWINMFKSFKK